MWQKFLKSSQKSIVVPPGFRDLKVIGDNRCAYQIKLKSYFKRWSTIDGEGNFIREAKSHEIIDSLRSYPKIYGSILQIDKQWLVLSDDTICRIHCTPNIEINPKLMTNVVCRRMGTAILFDDFDFRDPRPWNIDKALQLLSLEDLPDKAPKYLTTQQKLTFALLLEHEKNTRIPDTEKQIRNILSSQNASLLTLQNKSNGYVLTFNFRGRKRNIEINEDLMLQSSGMCLSGTDNNYALDTFLAILEHENSGEFGHPVYY